MPRCHFSRSSGCFESLSFFSLYGYGLGSGCGFFLSAVQHYTIMNNAMFFFFFIITCLNSMFNRVFFLAEAAGFTSPLKDGTNMYHANAYAV